MLNMDTTKLSIYNLDIFEIAFTFDAEKLSFLSLLYMATNETNGVLGYDSALVKLY